jgi:hypothetical protein
VDRVLGGGAGLDAGVGLGAGVGLDTGADTGAGVDIGFMSANLKAASLGGVAGRSLSDTRVEADDRPGEGIGSLWQRE